MKLTYLAALPLLATTATAQGSDSCASAQLIAGTGTFAFDNSAATTDGLPDGLCLFFGQPQIENDVWFEWVAPASGPYTVSTCGQTTLDSKIAVYDGSCAGALLACNDDSCSSLQSSLMFNASNAQTYIIRVGSYSIAGFGTGTIDIESGILLTAVNPANGHTYHLLSRGGWNAAEAAAVSLGGHLATVRSQAEHDFLLANFHIYQGNPIDMWIGFNDAALEGTFVWSSGETPGYTNWDLNEPSNGGTGEDYTHMRYNNPAAYWNDLPESPTGFHASPYAIAEIGSAFPISCTGDGLDPQMTTPCPCANTGAAGRGCDNSAATGGARLDGSGNINPDTVVLSVSYEIPGSLTIFLQGDADAPSGLVFGDGVRCVSGALKRLYVGNAAGGTMSAPGLGDLSISAMSASLGDPIAPGTPRWYQVYSRDPDPAFCPAPAGSTYNISNGLRIDW